MTGTNSQKADKRLNSLLYGAMAGFAFALAAWGWDAYQLAGSGAVLPWVKLAVGLPVTVLLGTLVAWLAARSHNTLTSALLWLVAGVVLTVLAVGLSYLEISLTQHWLAPEIAESTNVPLTGAAQIRMWIALLIIGLTCVFLGIFERVLIESEVTGASKSIRWLFMGICIPVALLGGYLGADIQINRPLRTPILSVHNALEFARANEGQAILPIAEREVQRLTDLPNYQISADLDFANHSFNGHLQVAYVNAEDVPLDSLFFRLFPNGDSSYGNGSLSVQQVKVDEQPVDTTLSLNNSVLEVKLPEPVQPGELRNIAMDFSGMVPLDYGGQNSNGYGIYNFSQNVMALSGWFPLLAVYNNDEGWNLDPVSGIGDSVFSDMASFMVQVSLPKDILLASTGVTTDNREVNSGLIQYTIDSGPARDFFMIMSPDFQVISQKVGATQVNSYYLPGNEQGAKQVLSVGGDSLRIFNQQFGMYPYVDLDLVDAPMRYASGVEFPGIVLIGDALYPDYANPTLTVATAHEVAHQWWYNLVGSDVIDDPWMDEALASYSSSLYYEFTQSPSAAQGLFSYYENRYQQAVEAGKDDQITRSETYFEDLNDPGRYGAIVYAKGMLFFRDLRQKIGDKAFFNALSGYFNTFKYRIASPDDLLDSFEKSSGRQLDDFYQQWLFSPD